jgi:hypothetical protein
MVKNLKKTKGIKSFGTTKSQEKKIRVWQFSNIGIAIGTGG